MSELHDGKFPLFLRAKNARSGMAGQDRLLILYKEVAIVNSQRTIFCKTFFEVQYLRTRSLGLAVGNKSAGFAAATTIPWTLKLGKKSASRAVTF